jgi:hypothetical protein
MKKTYDDGEGHCPGDPTLADVDPKQLNKLQKEYDKVLAIENPLKRSAAVKRLMKRLNG